MCAFTDQFCNKAQSSLPAEKQFNQKAAVSCIKYMLFF